MKSLVLSIQSLALLIISRAMADNCYWPNGDLSKSYVPCNVNPASTGPRACCAPTEPCLANKLCFSTAVGVVYRGACTDNTFQDPNCPKVFLTESPNNTANLIPCLNGYYRYSGGQCTDSDVFKWSSAGVIGLEAITASSITTGTASASATSTSACPAAVGSCDQVAQNAQRTVGLGVGLGLGLPLLAALVAVAYLLFAGRRRKADAPAYQGVPPAPTEEKPYQPVDPSSQLNSPPPQFSLTHEAGGQQVAPGPSEIDGTESSVRGYR